MEDKKIEMETCTMKRWAPCLAFDGKQKEIKGLTLYYSETNLGLQKCIGNYGPLCLYVYFKVLLPKLEFSFFLELGI